MPRLKVFTTPSGFYDLAVAAPSQAKALAAWGIHQNLFAQGMARVADDDATVAAALARPGVVLKRPLGAKGAFREDAALPTVKGGRRKAGKAKARDDAKARKAAADAARKLADAERAHAAERDRLARERAALDARIAAEDAAWSAQRRSLATEGKRGAPRKKR
ncbi:MAG: cell envelope biogenesis protein TolA [Rhizomicrobium sp.]